MTTSQFWSLLGDLSDVPGDYIADVAWTKRTLERWSMDPAFRAAFEADPVRALADMGSPLAPGQVRPFIQAMEAGEDHTADAGVPLSVLRYRHYMQEKIEHRREMREAIEPHNRRLAVWRRRQINRCRGELGSAASDAVIHAPCAFELSKGCTVGCWFCGVAAPKFDHTWPYTPQNAELWRGTLGVLREVQGPGVKYGFCYWATDPLDNPDYEHFMTDFHQVLGRCPQTTTALGHKDIDRTRQLLRLSQRLGSQVDRFSIISLGWLNTIHENFAPEELLRVECIPQNREAVRVTLKANAGRARKFAAKRKDELVPADHGSTIACVSGFLFNMVDQSVRLITPCASNERWPLGYWVLDQGTFASSAELRELLNHMIATKLRAALRVDDTVRLRPDVTVTVEQGEVQAMCQAGTGVIIRRQPDADDLAAMLAAGSHTAEEIALSREQRKRASLAETFALLDHLFAEGLLDEEPPSPREPAVIAGPGLGRREDR
jgi:radical SAM family RiPP maturation amino acid epimerase